jgi:hypothetical protein
MKLSIISFFPVHFLPFLAKESQSGVGSSSKPMTSSQIHLPLRIHHQPDSSHTTDDDSEPKDAYPARKHRALPWMHQGSFNPPSPPKSSAAENDYRVFHGQHSTARNEWMEEEMQRRKLLEEMHQAGKSMK